MLNFSRWILVSVAIFFLFAAPFVIWVNAFGQTPDGLGVPTDADWRQFFEAINGSAGAGAMGISVLVVQGLLLMIRGPLGALTGRFKLVLVTGLSLIVGVLGLNIAGFTWQAALMHSTTLAAIQVFCHQLYKNFIESPSQQ